MTNQTNITKGQHFVPRFYLENFSKNRGIQVYDRLKNRFFESSPKAMCKENYLYETTWESANPELGKYILFNKTEKILSDKEARWSVIIRKIIRRYELNKDNLPSGLICSKEEKNDLAEFIACTFLRHPYQLKKTQEFYADLTADDSPLDLVHAIGDLFNMWGWGSPKSLLEHSIKTMSFDPDMVGSPVNVLKASVLNMNMLFLCSNDSLFMTSSFPVLGEEDAYQQVFFPISPNIMIYCSDDPDTRFNRNRFYRATEETVETLNRMYLAQPAEACRYLISHDKKVIEHALSDSITKN